MQIVKYYYEKGNNDVSNGVYRSFKNTYDMFCEPPQKITAWNFYKFLLEYVDRDLERNYILLRLGEGPDSPSASKYKIEIKFLESQKETLEEWKRRIPMD